MKISKNHTLYYVWNEWTCEEVLLDFKPTKSDLKELCKLMKWPEDTKYIYANKVNLLYTKE
jgi:hypothetical protein